MKGLNKKAQEEMVGFVLIIVIVAVILLIFLGFYIRQDNSQFVESKETENFINSMLQYTTICKDNYGYVSISELIRECYHENRCLNGEESCVILENTVEDLIDSAWEGKNNLQGYEINISSGRGKIVYFLRGNQTGNYKGDIEDFGGSENIQVIFNAYY